MDIIKKSILPFISFLFSANSLAGIITFDFDDGAINDGTYSHTINGVQLDISAWLIESTLNNDTLSKSPITETDKGTIVWGNSIGLRHPINGGRNISGYDDNEPDEGLLFSFSQAVSLESILFNSWGNDDDFNFSINDENIFTDFGSGDTNFYAFNSTGSQFNFTNIYTDQFLIWADDSSDSFLIDALVISVPEPPTLLLFLFGLAALLKNPGNKIPAFAGMTLKLNQPYARPYLS